MCRVGANTNAALLHVDVVKNLVCRWHFWWQLAGICPSVSQPCRAYGLTLDHGPNPQNTSNQNISFVVSHGSRRYALLPIANSVVDQLALCCTPAARAELPSAPLVQSQFSVCQCDQRDEMFSPPQVTAPCAHNRSLCSLWQIWDVILPLKLHSRTSHMSIEMMSISSPKCIIEQPLGDCKVRQSLYVSRG